MHNLKPPQNSSSSVARGWFALALVALLFVGLPWIKNHLFDDAATTTPAQTLQPTPVSSAKESAAQNSYAGDEACRSCHQDKVNSYHRTAHHFTSSLPSKNSISGNFTAGANTLKTVNTNLNFEMRATASGYFQTAVLKFSPSQTGRRAERFDVVIGSGRKGQTYLFWQDDQLFQLPVSYWTELHEWINSPGTVEGTINFEREIIPRCLECHASNFASLAPPENRFGKTSLALGLACEKCHGPGREHIARFRSQSPPRSAAEFATINPAKLSRDRQMDICALCHAGVGNPRSPALSFFPGDALEDHLELPNPGPEAQVDVHGAQVQLLKRSRCFQSSTTMTCSTCHDVHTPQRDLEASASRCLTCHKVEKCGTFPKLGHAIDRQCVTCHMPLQPSLSAVVAGDGSKLHPKVRNHRIGIYPDVQLP